MGTNNSSQQKRKFQFIDSSDVQQSIYRPTNQKTSLQTNKFIQLQTSDGPANGDVGQFTGLNLFIIPQKYAKFMHENPLRRLDQSTHGQTGYDPYMFKKSLNVYHGEWKEGKPHGYGKVFNPDRDFYYEGYFEEGLPSQYGVFINDHINYRGQLKFGRAEGLGVYKQNDTIIEGEFKQNAPFKNCRQKGPNYQFQGDYENGKWKKGKLIWNNAKSIYEGDFTDGLFHGNGILSTQDYRYQGQFLNGKLHGQGKITWKSGQSYKGDFQNNQINGIGELFKDNKLIFKGQFVNGKANGQGCVLENQKYIYVLWNEGGAQSLL